MIIYYKPDRNQLKLIVCIGLDCSNRACESAVASLGRLRLWAPASKIKISKLEIQSKIWLKRKKWLSISEMMRSVKTLRFQGKNFVLQHLQPISQVYFIKVHTFWEGHKILRNLPLTYDYSTYSQKEGKDFAKFVAFSEYMSFIFKHDMEL